MPIGYLYVSVQDLHLQRSAYLTQTGFDPGQESDK